MISKILPQFEEKPLTEVLTVSFLTEDFGEAALGEYRGRVNADYNGNEILNVLSYQNGVVQGSNPFAVVLINQFLPENMRVATLSDLEIILRPNALDLRGIYEDLALVLRNTENPNADLARNLDEQIKTRGEFQYPVMVSLTDLEIVNDPSSSYCLSLNLRDDAQIIYEPQLAHENDGKKFLETGESGLPVFCDNGKRILYTRENGLSRLSLGRFSYFYSVWGNLGSSYPDGRIIVLSGKTTK